MRDHSTLLANAFIGRFVTLVVLLFLSACATTPEKVVAPVEVAKAWSVTRVVDTDQSLITLLDPFDLSHHQSEPADWYRYDFAVQDDLKSGRFAGVITEHPGKFKVRVTFGELNDREKQAAGPEAKLRLRVINHRLLLSGGETLPSVDSDIRRYANDPRWIGIPNGDYGVIITAIDPAAQTSDYVFQLIRVSSITAVKHAPAVPQLIVGQQAAVVGINARGFQFNEQCYDVPRSVTWAPLSTRTMLIPGAYEAVELPEEVYRAGLSEQQNGNNAAIPLVLSRNPEVGAYGFYLKPRNWQANQVLANGDVVVDAHIRCAVQITDVLASPDEFSLRVKAVPTAGDRLTSTQKQQLMDGFDNWLRATNDPAWRFKSAKVQRSSSDASMILGVLDYLNFSANEAEQLLPMSNALRVDYLINRFKQ